MPADEPVTTTDRARASGGRLRRSGRALVRLGALLAALSLVVTLLSGWATRSLLEHLQTNSAELLDGAATVPLTQGEERTLYVTGGLIAPGELVPTPVEQISCTILGPDQQPVLYDDRSQDRIGLDTGLARLQVLGSFEAQGTGDHELSCDGLGVVIAPEINPASALARLGGLALGSLGTIAGLTMLLIGGGLLLLIRREDADEDAPDDLAAPPSEGADEWWEDGTGERPDGPQPPAEGLDGAGEGLGGAGEGQVGQDDLDGDPDDYVELSEEELAALSEEEIEELVASGALVFVDEDEPEADAPRS